MTDILLRAPRVRLNWAVAGTPLTIYFKSYRVYRRAAIVGAQWQRIAELDVPAGYTATTVELQHRWFDDYMMGWGQSASEWENGWDYVVTMVDIINNETVIAATGVSERNKIVTVADTPWFASNSAPWLNFPLKIVQDVGSEIDSQQTVTRYAGRDRFVALTPEERPGRLVSFSAQFLDTVGPYSIRTIRAAANSGYEFALHRKPGDRVIGKLAVTGFGDAHRLRQVVSGNIFETDGSTVANYNLPAGIVLNGSSQYLTTASAAHLNPGSSAFSIVCAAQFADAASARALSKGNLGTADGYGFQRDASGSLQFFVDGATTSGGPSEASATWFSDVRVAVGTTSGTAQVLYRDGTSVGTSTVTHGSVTNSVALVAGANNGGASGFMACAPLRAYALYLRELTADEAKAASYYLLGYPGYSMPRHPVLFFDLRDDRTWLGTGTTLVDLAEYANTATITASPVTRGIPWPLSRTELV